MTEPSGPSRRRFPPFPADWICESSAGITGNPLTGRHQIRFDGSDGRILIRTHAAAIDRIAGVLDLGQDDVRIDRLRIEALGSRAEGSGVVREFTAPTLALTLHASIDAARAAAFLDMRAPISGTVAVGATVRGPLSAPAIETRVSGSHLRFRSLGAAQFDARAAYDGLARRAELSSARVDAPWGRVAASGRFALDRQHTSRVRAEINALSLPAVMHAVNLPYAVDTRMDGNLDAEWPGLDYLEASALGTATLTPIAAQPTQATGRAIPLGGYVSARRSRGTTDVGS